MSGSSVCIANHSVKLKACRGAAISLVGDDSGCVNG